MGMCWMWCGVDMTSDFFFVGPALRSVKMVGDSVLDPLIVKAGVSPPLLLILCMSLIFLYQKTRYAHAKLQMLNLKG